MTGPVAPRNAMSARAYIRIIDRMVNPPVVGDLPDFAGMTPEEETQHRYRVVKEWARRAKAEEGK